MTGPSSVARRLLERFSLITFGLYHLPLLLNNYPSLGGGGFNDTGLAVRWGHVFTVPGLWVARHFFHMTGPMTGGSQGDNGDVAEEFGRLLLSVVIGAVAALAWTMADRRRPRGEWVGEATRTLLRYSITLGLASYGVAKILPMQFPPLGAIALDQRVGDLTPMALLWNFMEYSRPYALFGGVMELVAVVLLCFRRTATLGALVCLAVMTNVALLNYAYGVPVKLYATMIVVSAGVLVLYDARRLIAVFLKNVPAPAAESEPLFHDRIPNVGRWAIKVALVGSVMVSSVAAMHHDIGARTAASSPLDGGWTVTSFTTIVAPANATTKPARWTSFIIEGGRAMIRFEDNALLGCRETQPDRSTRLSLSCANNRKGELLWMRTGDTLQIDLIFDDARIAATARRRDYTLLHSQFRMIADR